MAHLDEDEYEIPLRDQRYFGAGIKRKRVQFVPSTSAARATRLPSTPTTSASSRYLDIVLKHKQSASTADEGQTALPTDTAPLEAGSAQSDAVGEDEGTRAVCDICRRNIGSDEQATTHHSSLTHQICLQHSHPPSHLDRRRKGLQVLSSHGWDPDSRLGLGAAGEGILHPIKALENPDRYGLGLKPADLEKKRVKEKPVKLDAGKIRAVESEKKKRGEKLRDAFYRNEEVEKYLGGDGERNTSLDIREFKQVRKRGLG